MKKVEMEKAKIGCQTGSLSPSFFIGCILSLLLLCLLFFFTYADGFLTTQKTCYELKIGMKANSDEEAYDMYNGYAFNKGFSIRRDDKTFKRGMKKVIRRSFVCLREGFRQFSDPSEEKKCNRLDSRCGCGARVIFKVENGVYEIS